MRISILLDMVLGIFRRLGDRINRKMQRDFLNDPENAPRRYAMFMGLILFISLGVGYNLLYDPEKHRKG